MIAGTYQGFEVTVDDKGVALFTFTNPERLNAMSFGTRRDLVEVVTLAQVDDEVRVIVITGSGKGFVAGAYLRPDHSDLHTLGSDPGDDPTTVSSIADSHHVPVNLQNRLRFFSQEMTRTVRRSDKITIAAVNGYAIQLGLSLALACDYVIAARSAKMGSATLRMGYQPDEGGHWLLVEHLGVKGALDFMLRSRIVDGEEAQRLGLATEVVDDEVLLDRALDLAHELADGPQVAMRLLKRATYNAAQLTFEQAGEDIATRTAISDFHDDALEGFPSWKRKEKPAFNAWLGHP